MADSDTYYSSLSQKQYYVDKSGVLGRELERFPSVYLGGHSCLWKDDGCENAVGKTDGSGACPVPDGGRSEGSKAMCGEV